MRKNANGEERFSAVFSGMGGGEAPKPKFQMPNKLQTLDLKGRGRSALAGPADRTSPWAKVRIRAEALAGCHAKPLNFGLWSFFGAWDLELGISRSASRCHREQRGGGRTFLALNFSAICVHKIMGHRIMIPGQLSWLRKGGPTMILEGCSRRFKATTDGKSKRRLEGGLVRNGARETREKTQMREGNLLAPIYRPTEFTKSGGTESSR